MLAVGISTGQDDEPEFGAIDRYLLIRKIGEGGMGEVWLAEQTEPVRRRVAIKVMKAGVTSREVIARFESEGLRIVASDQRVRCW
jgi:serine/threonine protein kinase